MTLSTGRIGVVASDSDLEIADEFFELFKTPWEPAVPGRKYAVVLSTARSLDGLDADVSLVYGSQEQAADREAEVAVTEAVGPVDVEWSDWTFPVYGRLALFDAGTRACGRVAGGEAIGYVRRSGGRHIWRIGYDLFREVRSLLADGQPASHAMTPTLELHIALLRHLLQQSGVPFAEVLPRPRGYDFICCLTHDVDFYGVRRHRFDRTLAGFIARASLGSWIDLVRGRRTAAEAARNLKALLSLPFVFLGLARDFWSPFDDYARVEDPARSTFFLVPFKDRPGVGPDGASDGQRAVRYQASDVSDESKAAAARGSELGVHGINAWCNAAEGRAELEQLTAVTARRTCGVRMHWLYFSADSPRQLEAAGFDYDSTWGFNETVGYRAGTSQVFKLPGTESLMELPLSIMDSAMFHSDRMGRGPRQIPAEGRRVVAQARRFGGTLVINWHCRSLAPERLWVEPYRELLEEVGRDDRAWFATAAEAVDWFRWRRSIRFAEHPSSGVPMTVSAPRSSNPGGVIRLYRPGPTGTEVKDLMFDGTAACAIDVQHESPVTVRLHG